MNFAVADRKPLLDRRMSRRVLAPPVWAVCAGKCLIKLAELDILLAFPIAEGHGAC